MIKNNKGFTMVELLAAVTILGILATIAIVSVTNTMEKSHKEYDEKQNKLFTTAAQTYFTDNRSELPKKLLTTNTVTLKKLIEENYIEEIVDYKKKAYDKEKSVATIKKTGAGKYMYYSTLVREDGKSVSDAPATNNNKGNVNITINDPNLASTDMQKSFTESDRIIYYVNKEITIPVNLTGTSGISSYQYRIDKLSTVSSSEGKKYKISGEIAVDAPSFSDTLTINAKDFANGIYRLSINAYGYQAEASTKDASYIIVIDKTKPKCTIGVSGTKGNQVEGLNNVYWYKQGNLSAIMKITEKNKYKYTLGFDEMQYNIDYKTDNTKEEEQLPITQNIVDKNVYGYVKDKAGNVGECKTENPIYYDNTVPTCKINISGGDYHSTTTWYWDDISLSLARYDDNGTNQSEQGENESGVYQYDMSTNNYAANQITTYTNSSNKTQSNETPGIIWYGYLKDKAGNQGKCETATLKLDKYNPTCTPSITSGTKGNNGWYTSNVGIQGSCSDTASGSGCKNNSTNTITGEGEKTGTLGNVCDKSGRCSACNSVTVSIDKTCPTISISGNSASSWYSVTNSGKFSLTLTGKVGPSGATIYGDWDNDNPSGYIMNVGYSSNGYSKNTSEFSSERDGEDRYYKIVGNRNDCSDTKYVTMYIDNTAPNIKSCSKVTNEYCGSPAQKFDYAMLPYVEDDLSGYGTATWYWGSHSNTVSRNYAGYTECMGTSSQLTSYAVENLCDRAGNCRYSTKTSKNC